MTRSTPLAIAVLALVSLLHPVPAAAQAVGTATIAGTVTDSSGAVLPGVTVEATSPALIEGTRSVITNEAGRYSVVNLRPGTYAVTFSLTGFTTHKRDGIELTSDFTATVNPQLSIGGVAESVTVQALTPIVDVQNVGQPVVYGREAIDALPTERTPNAILFTIPGTAAGNFGLFTFRGSNDSLTMVDGMRMTFLVGAGPGTASAPNSSNMYQEFSFSTNIDSAEVGQPGMRINLVPRDGGNTFRGTVFTRYGREEWQGDNLDDELVAQGLRAPAKTLKEWDVNPSAGGPISRNRLWYYATYQSLGEDTLQEGSFFDADPAPHRYVADVSRPGSIENRSHSFAPRLTWQVNSRDKVAGFYERFRSEQPFFFATNQTRLLNTSAPGPLPPEATQDNSSATDSGGIRWTRTHSSRLLFEATSSSSVRNVYNDYRGDVAAWSGRNILDAGVPQAGPTTFVIGEVSTNQLLNVANNSSANLSSTIEFRSSATYVTGSHNVKVGASFFHGYYRRPVSVLGNVVLRVDEGVSSEAVKTLPTNRRDNMDADWGFFVQDRWTVNRLTAFLGLRLDWLQTSVPAQVLPASVWLAEQRFDGREVLDWKDLSPRLGLSYDLFGNGRTALKVAVARFVAGETVNLTGNVNPMNAISTTDTVSWNDANGDFTIYHADGTVQVDELGPTGNRNFGTPEFDTTFDNDALEGWFKRGYTWETNVSVQHELLPRVGASALYYRRTTGNQRVTDNRAIDASSFDGPFCITVPTTDDRLPIAGEQVCDLYDIKPAFRGLEDNFVTFAESVGVDREDTRTGVELNINARLPRGAFVSGGVSFANQHQDDCDVIDNPEGVRFCETDSGYRPDIKLSGAYVLPLDVRVSGTYRGLDGPQVLATWRVPNTTIARALGRNLAACPARGTCRSTKSVPLIEPGTEYISMRHAFDLRFSKLLRFDRYRLQLSADLLNAFNDNGVQTINTTFATTNSSWLNATGVQAPRQFQVSAQFDF